MRALDRKMLRDLWQLRSQVFTVALVVASGIGGFVGSLSTYDSLQWARESFYDEARFAHLFTEIKRAPRAIENRITEIPGVADAETTIRYDVTLDIPGIAEPVVGRMIGLANGGEPRLNQLVIRRGRNIDPAQTHEAVVSEGFANTRKIKPGDRIVALLNGKRETLEVVGVGLSPDYIFATQGGAFPDDRNFGVFWMDRTHLASAYNMEGAFNNAAVRLAPNASERAVIDQLDRLFEPYGGLNAYGRDEQISNRILSQEIAQWKVIGILLPSIFLGVAAFLVNVVLGRQISTQREQIAALKALGYGNATVAWHYMKQVFVIILLGIVMGTLLGGWMGESVTALYARYFHFPNAIYRMAPSIVILASAITSAAAIAGAMNAVRKVVRLFPAEAMRPPFPGQYRRTIMERIGLGALLSPAMRMVVRNMERRPLRASLTVFGIASALAIIISGLFWNDAVAYMVSVQFEAAQRSDAEIALSGPTASRVRHEFAQMPGVSNVEVSRDVAARLTFGHRFYRTAIQGIPREGELRRLLDADLRRIPAPPEGLLLTDRLAERLGAKVGDRLLVELMDGNRAKREVVIVGVVRDLIGLFAYMDLSALNHLMNEGETATIVSVTVDRTGEDAFFAQLRKFPKVAFAASKTAMLSNFRETSARNILVFTTILTVFASLISIGVVYNNARIALSERAWELASLRVLGFTRGEVSIFLLGELAIEIVAAIPIGCALGYWLSWTIVTLTHTDMISIPIIVAPRTYAYASVSIVIAGVLSALIVRHRIDHLDLVAVLKTRE